MRRFQERNSVAAEMPRSRSISPASSKASTLPMLWPNMNSGRSRYRSITAYNCSLRSAMLSANGSVRRSCRPGYCTASTSIEGASALATGTKNGADPPACGRQSSRGASGRASPKRRIQRASSWAGEVIMFLPAADVDSSIDGARRERDGHDGPQGCPHRF